MDKYMPPVVDYEKHPGFAGLNCQFNYNNHGEMLALVNDIDDRYLRLLSSQAKTIDQLKLDFNEICLPKIQSLEAMVVETLKSDTKMVQWVSQSFGETKKVMLDEAISKIKYNSKKNIQKTQRRFKSHDFDTLQQDGFVTIPYTKKLQEELRDAVQPYVAQLREQAKKEPLTRCCTSVMLYGKFGRIMRTILNDFGALDIASWYKGYPLEFDYAALDYSHENQTWYRECYKDVGLPTSPLTTMHWDYENTMMKGMIYINEVKDAAQGAFHVVPGSCHWKKSHLLFNLYKDLDLEFPKVYQNTYSGPYYRARFVNKDLRQITMNLPKFMRGSSHFGDDLVDGEPLTTALSKLERPLLGGDPVFAVFDGPANLHRGALTYKGERIAIQLGFKVPPEIHPVTKLYKRARTMAGRALRGESPI